jgi:predicted acylesterase/phospholipase RssA
VNHPGESGANGWNLQNGDKFLVADIDGNRLQEIVVISPNGEWIGILKEDNGRLAAGWIGHDWVNHPSATLDEEKIRGSGIILRIAAVSLETGKLRFVNEFGRFIDANKLGKYIKEDTRMSPVSIADAVVASSSIPMVFPPLKLHDDNYTDGGIRTLLPIRAAIDAGATTIYAIAAGDPEIVKAPSFDNSKLLQIGYRALTEIMLDEILQKEINPPTRYSVIPIMVQSTVHIHDSLVVDPGLISISIDYGYMRAFDVVDGGAKLEQLVAISDEITRLRVKIWSVEARANGKYTENEMEERALWKRIHPGEVQLIRVPSPEALDEVRDLKKALKELVDQRKSLGGNLPANHSSWWLNWERHNWTSIMDSPWSAFSSRAASRPEVPNPFP